MPQRNIVRLYPFPRSINDGTFDLPADAPPICAVSFGPVEGAVYPVPVMVWIPFVDSTYEEDTDPS